MTDSTPGALRAGQQIAARFRKALPHLPTSTDETLAEIIDKETAASMLLRVMRQINEVANDTTVAWEARLYQIKHWSEKAIRIAEREASRG